MKVALTMTQRLVSACAMFGAFLTTCVIDAVSRILGSGGSLMEIVYEFDVLDSLSLQQFAVSTDG